jgi:acetate kinase
LQGISGVSSDMREVLKEVKNGDKKAQYAFDIFCYRIRKYIGAYAAAMGGLDAVIFTGGIGENSPDVRKECCKDLGFLGVEMDDAANESSDKEKFINTKNGRIKVLVIPTNEELVIAMDTMKIVRELKPA